MGQAGIEAERQVGRADHLLDQLVHRLGQPLPAIFDRRGERGPAAFAELAIGFLETGGRADDAVLQLAALDVARGVQRQQDLLRDARRLFEDGVVQFGTEFVLTRDGAELVLLEQLMEDETHVA